MSEIEDQSVELVVTSPHYPMIDMWDNILSNQNSDIATALLNKDGNSAFELMKHQFKSKDEKKDRQQSSFFWEERNS